MVVTRVDILKLETTNGGAIHHMRRSRMHSKVRRRIMPGQMDERDERRLYELLGRIQATLESNNRDATRDREELRNEIRDVAKAANQSREQLHADIVALTARVGSVEKAAADGAMMAQNALNQITVFTPTISEHQAIKLKADGVTIALKHIGKIVYLTGAAFIAMVGTSVAYLMHLFGGSGLPPGK